MVKRQTLDIERIIDAAFQAGFSNAADSLSQLSNFKVSYNNFHSGNCQLRAPYLTHDMYKRYNQGSRILLTTEIFGELTGKSYLFFSQQEYELLTREIPKGSNLRSSLKEEFLKELDNILSASVITKIANDLNRKMFGDIPVLAGQTKSPLEDIINNDFGGQVEELYITSIFFSFEKHPEAQPLFLWAVNHNNVEASAMKAGLKI